jgi:FixJ family two-component response regulator
LRIPLLNICTSKAYRASSETAIVTNEMPNDVYKFLEKKAERKELTPYIIKLVQQDMLNQQIRMNFDELHDALRSLTEKNRSN